MTISDPSQSRRIAALERQVEQLSRLIDTQARAQASYKEPRNIWIGRTYKEVEEDYPGPEANTFRVELLAPVFDDSAPGQVQWPNGYSEAAMGFTRGTKVIAQSVQNEIISVATPGATVVGGYHEEGSAVVVARIANNSKADFLALSGGWWIISGSPAGLLIAQDANNNNLSSTGGGYSLDLPIGSVVFNKSPYWEATNSTTLTCKRNGYYHVNLSVTFQSDGIDCWPGAALNCSTTDFWNLSNTNYFHGVGGSVVKTQTFHVSGVMGFYNGTTLGATISVPSYSASVVRVTNVQFSLEYIRTVY